MKVQQQLVPPVVVSQTRTTTVTKTAAATTMMTIRCRGFSLSVFVPVETHLPSTVPSSGASLLSAGYRCFACSPSSPCRLHFSTALQYLLLYSQTVCSAMMTMTTSTPLEKKRRRTTTLASMCETLHFFFFFRYSSDEGGHKEKLRGTFPLCFDA